MGPIRTSLAIVILGLLGCRDSEQSPSDVDCSVPPEARQVFQTISETLTMDEILEQMVLCVEDPTRAIEQAESRAADAPADIKAVLSLMYQNIPPDSAALAEMGPDRLNALFHLADRPAIHSTLLAEAVEQRNYRWAKALLEAGADPNASESLMAYRVSEIGIFDPRSKWYHFYEDGRPAVPFLELYLAHGGDVNATGGGGYGTKPLARAPFNNIAAQLFLLEQGTDGWETGTEKVGRFTFYSSAFGTMLRGVRSANSNEGLYTTILAGHFKQPDEPFYLQFMEDLLLEELRLLTDEAEGPRDRHRLWTMQQVIRALIEHADFTASPEMETLLADHRVPDAEGGWVTPADQLHQHYDDDRQGATLGREIW